MLPRDQVRSRHLVLGSVLALLLGEALAIYRMNAGEFTYSLDDAYIHLSLARQIAQGHYGLHPSDVASPSSSIVWPFVLALFAPLPFFELAPLLINSALALFAAKLTHDVVWGASLPFVLKERTALVAAVSLAILLAVGLVPSVFWGLEHTAQLSMSALAVRALSRASHAERLGIRDLWPLFLGTLLRYENLALAAAGVALLWLEGRRRAALQGLALALVGPCLFGTFLLSLGLPFLPSSVLAKSYLASAPGLAELGLALLGHAADALVHTNRGAAMGVCFAASLGLALAIKAEPRGAWRVRSLAVSMALTTALHLLVGEYGRYELYAATYCLLGGALAVGRLFRRGSSVPGPDAEGPGDEVPQPGDCARPRGVAAALATLVLVLGAPYVGRLFQTPYGAHSIWAQQGTMAQISAALGAPVAVNDIGLVQWRSSHAVLDLWGLGSAEALALRRSRSDRRWMQELAEARGVRFALIYEAWFADQIPPTWIRVGELNYEGPLPSVADRRVAMFAVDPSAAVELERVIHETLARGGQVPRVSFIATRRG